MGNGRLIFLDGKAHELVERDSLAPRCDVAAFLRFDILRLAADSRCRQSDDLFFDLAGGLIRGMTDAVGGLAASGPRVVRRAVGIFNADVHPLPFDLEDFAHDLLHHGVNARAHVSTPTSTVTLPSDSMVIAAPERPAPEGRS